MTLQIENRYMKTPEYFQFVENALTLNVISDKQYYGMAHSELSAKIESIKYE